MIKACLFDLDGTLCDCTELHYITLNKALEEISGYIISREDHNLNFNGLPTNKKLDLLILNNKVNINDKSKIWQLKQKYTKETILEVLNPDLKKQELLSYLKSENIKIACVTNSINETAKLMLETTGQFKYLDLLISSDLVKNPKPDSEGFEVSMTFFNVLPSETLIIEDSPVGIAAAKASGANIWKVKDPSEVILENYIKLNY